MAACWRELSRRQDVDLFILSISSNNNTAFADSVMEGIQHKTLNHSEIQSKSLIKNIVFGQEPDVLVVSGWSIKSYVGLFFEPSLKNIRHILTMDNSRKHNIRQALGRLKLYSFLKRIDIVFVPGERAWQLAKYFGVQEERIRRGLYGIDFERLSDLFEIRLTGEWPRAFLYVGQFIERKGLDTLVNAYMQYRGLVDNPWPLKCCGGGPLSEVLAGKSGIHNIGFVQPLELQSVMASSGVLILPSRDDAWPLVIAEACASGLPVICTESCGSSVEIVRSLYNGITIPADDTRALCDALNWMHNHYDNLAEMGRRSRHLAAPYSAQSWADRFLDACRQPVNLQ